MKRFKNAKAIIDGACNPIAIANALVDAIAEIREESLGHDAILEDPAVRCIVFQLAHLTRAFKMERDIVEFCRVTDEVTRKLEETK